MLDFLTLKPFAFGLDISDLSLKIIQLKKRGKFFGLTSFGETKMRPGIIDQGEIKDERVLSENIKKAVSNVKGSSLKTRYVVASLPEEKAFLQVISLPLMKKEEAEKAVYFEAENYIPLPIEKVYLDSQIISRSAKHLNVLISALPRETVDPYVSALKKADLKPVALEIECISISRALIKKGESPKPLLLIDLGESRTGLSIFFDNSLRFTTSCQISSKQFNEAIVNKLNVSLKKAEELKIKHGITDSKKGKEITEALSSNLNELIEQTKKYLGYSQGEYHQKITKVLLCGGGVNLKGFVEFFSDQLKMPVELSNPWVNILPAGKKETSKLTYQESLRYTTALGLALRGVQKND